MQRKTSIPVWPHIGIVACLFMLSVLAVQAWRSFRPSTVSGDHEVVVSDPVTAPREASVSTILSTRYGATILADRATQARPEATTQKSPPVEIQREETEFQTAEIDVPTDKASGGGGPDFASPKLSRGSTSATAVSTGPRVAKDLARSREPPLARAPSTPPPPIGPHPSDQSSSGSTSFSAPRSAAPSPDEPSEVLSPSHSVLGGLSAPEMSTDVLPVRERSPSPWPNPAALLSRLEVLSQEPCRKWSRHVLAELQRLRNTDSLASPEAAAALQELRMLEEMAAVALTRVDSIPQRQELISTHYALQRRLDIWWPIHELARQRGDVQSLSNTDIATLRRSVQDVESMLSGRKDEQAWRARLRLTKLGPATAGAGPSNRNSLRRLARRILQDTQPYRLDDAQRQFLLRPPPATLLHQLRRWACLPIEGEYVLATIEQFEQSESWPRASELADVCDRLQFGSSAKEVELGQRLGMHYRNANIRFAATEELINRLVPNLDTVEEPVRDRILGAAVSGRSATDSQLFVRLLPDPRRIRFQLEARGVVASDTASEKGPVTLFNDGESTYLAQKLFLLDRTGLRSTRAGAMATSRTRLKGLRSEYDDILLVGSVIRSVARQQQHDQRQQVRAEVEHRIRSRARGRLDLESQLQLSETQRRVQTRLIEPLDNLGLEPAVVDTKTTRQRIITRCRLAASHQLAAFTARPQALANSLASVQIHQSVINNLLQQLALDGSRNDLKELYRRVLDDVGLPHAEIPEEVPNRVTIQFAQHDALRVRFSEGRITLELKIAEMVSRSRKWRNFTVRVRYREELNGLEARLVRDGIIELIGPRLGILDQTSLRAIFTKVFGRERVLPIIPSTVAHDSRLAGLRISQFTVRDGWMGIAIGGSSGPTAQFTEKKPGAATRTQAR